MHYEVMLSVISQPYLIFLMSFEKYFHWRGIYFLLTNLSNEVITIHKIVPGIYDEVQNRHFLPSQKLIVTSLIGSWNHQLSPVNYILGSN